MLTFLRRSLANSTVKAKATASFLAANGKPIREDAQVQQLLRDGIAREVERTRAASAILEVAESCDRYEAGEDEGSVSGASDDDRLGE